MQGRRPAPYSTAAISTAPSCSYAYDGKRLKKWHVDAAPYGERWAAGDVIGCSLDMDAGSITYYRNGRSLGGAFEGVRRGHPGAAYFPGVSALSNSNTTNWLETNAPDLYFYATALEAARDIRDQQEVVNLAPMVAGLIESIRRASERKGQPSTGSLQIKPRRQA